MDTVFFSIASIVLVEVGYYLFLLIKRERELHSEEMYSGVTVLDSIRQEFRDG